ncbi:MAG: hypothetical protein H6618_03305 [Deltaproteobacteria bacterium]|nr:hypothetical protein [Deltaproteobacteria bacterium]
MGGLSFVAIAGYKYFASKSAEETETPEDGIIGAMDSGIDSVLNGADPSLLPEPGLVPVGTDLVPVIHPCR